MPIYFNLKYTAVLFLIFLFLHSISIAAEGQPSSASKNAIVKPSTSGIIEPGYRATHQPKIHGGLTLEPDPLHPYLEWRRDKKLGRPTLPGHVDPEFMRFLGEKLILDNPELKTASTEEKARRATIAYADWLAEDNKIPQADFADSVRATIHGYRDSVLNCGQHTDNLAKVWEGSGIDPKRIGRISANKGKGSIAGILNMGGGALEGLQNVADQNWGHQYPVVYGDDGVLYGHDVWKHAVEKRKAAYDEYGELLRNAFKNDDLKSVEKYWEQIPNFFDGMEHSPFVHMDPRAQNNVMKEMGYVYYQFETHAPQADVEDIPMGTSVGEAVEHYNSAESQKHYERVGRFSHPTIPSVVPRSRPEPAVIQIGPDGKTMHPAADKQTAFSMVPHLVGLTQQDAENALGEAGLTASVTTEIQNMTPPGQVIRQSPAGGSGVQSGSTVDIVVSDAKTAAASKPDNDMQAETERFDCGWNVGYSVLKKVETDDRIYYLDAGGRKHGPDVNWFFDKATWKRTDQVQTQVCWYEDVAHGKSRQWYPNGEILWEGFLEHGKRQGTISEGYNNGNPHKQWTYDQDVLTGPYLEWFKNGQLRFSGEYTNKVKTGTWREWGPQGECRTILDYGDGSGPVTQTPCSP